MDMSDIWKLAHLLRQNGDKVLNDGSKLSLTASLLQKLNDAFLIIVDCEESRNAFQVVSANNEQDELFYNLHFLHDFVQKVVALKIEQNLPFRVPFSRNFIVNISKFKNLKYLELKKIHIHNITGLQVFRSQLQAIVCIQCINKLEEFLSSCGGDQSSDFMWSELHEAVFSYNSITTLDSSLSLAPWLHILDLSHNNLTSGEGLQYLLCLRYLNLGYNCLLSVPPLSKNACVTLQVLILKNNFIECGTGLSGLENLMEVDFSCNFITTHNSLQPLCYMPALSVLCLEGNPLCFSLEYRTSIAGMLHHNAAINQFVLDGIPLTKLEKFNVGNAAKAEEVVIPFQLLEKRDDAQQTSVPSSSVKPQRGRRGGRVREAVISEQLGVEGKADVPAVLPSSSMELSSEHLETKKQVEMLREKFGEDDWLHHLGGSCLQDVLGMEKTAPPDLGKTLQQCFSAVDDEVKTISEETTMNSPGQGNVTVSVRDRQPGSANEVAVSQTCSAEEEVLKSSDLKVFALEAATDEKSQSVLLQEPQEEEQVEEADDDIADVKLYLVQKRRPGVDILDEMFLVVTDSLIKERDMVSGKTREKWTVETLLSCTKTSNDPVTIQLTFDTVRRDRQERVYIMDEEDAEQLMHILSEILDSRSLAAMNQVVFHCFKCQSQFTQELGGKVAAKPDSKSVVCPTCCSSVVIIIDEVPLPSKVSAAREEASNVAVLENFTSTMTKYPSQCSIGPRSCGADTLEVTAVVHHPSSPAECIQPAASLCSATSLNQSPERFQDTNAPMRRCESDIEIISNPSQSSIEVLDDSGRIHGSTPARKSSSDEKASVPVVTQLNSIKGMIMTESSSSGSLTDSICTAYENQPDIATSDVKSPPGEGECSLLNPKVTGNVDSARMASVSESSDDTLEGAEEKAAAIESTPEVGITYTSVLEDLLQSVTSRIPQTSGAQTESPAAGNGFRYSYSDFSAVDHRVKLHLYVRVFGDQEQLVLLLKARIVHHCSEAPIMGCLVFSTSKIHLLQITGPESDEPQDWLRLEDSWPANSLKTISLLPSEQGVSFEFKNSGGAVSTCCLAILQYSTYTTQFLEFLSGLSMPDKYNISIRGTSDRHVLLIQQLTLSMPTDEGSDTALHHFVIFSHCVIRRGGENVKALRIGVFVLTDTALLVTDDNVEWLFPTSSVCPEPSCIQSMSNLVELETEGFCLTLHFVEESTQCEELWIIAVDLREMVDALANSVKLLWEDLFSVPLQVIDRNKGSDNC